MLFATGDEGGSVSYVLYLALTVFFTLVAVVLTTQSPAAAGSGIPQTKAILSVGGALTGQVLDPLTLIVKIAALGFSVGAGRQGRQVADTILRSAEAHGSRSNYAPIVR